MRVNNLILFTKGSTGCVVLQCIKECVFKFTNAKIITCNSFVNKVKSTQNRTDKFT